MDLLFNALQPIYQAFQTLPNGSPIEQQAPQPSNDAPQPVNTTDSQNDEQECDFNFPGLISELQGEIISHLDYGSRSCLGFTCKTFVHLNAQFDILKCIDTCAKLGYVHLLKYIDQGKRGFDHTAALVAIRHGQAAAIEYYMETHPRLHDYAFPFAEEAVLYNQEAIYYSILRKVGVYRGERWENIQRVKHYEENLKLSLPPKVSPTDLDSLPNRNNIKVLACRLLIINHAAFWQQRLLKAENHDAFLSIFEKEPNKFMQEAKESGMTLGDVRFLQLAKERGLVFDRQSVSELFMQEAMQEEGANHLECLQYIHAVLEIDHAPTKDKWSCPWWASIQDIEWMEEKGYQFKDKYKGIKFFKELIARKNPILFKKELEFLLHFLKINKDIDIKPLICDFTKLFREDVIIGLLQLPQTTPAIPDSTTIPFLFVDTYLSGESHLQRRQLLKFAKIIKLLVDNHFTFDPNGKAVENFFYQFKDKSSFTQKVKKDLGIPLKDDNDFHHL